MPQRVTLLLLTTGLFAAAWDCDRQSADSEHSQLANKSIDSAVSGDLPTGTQDQPTSDRLRRTSNRSSARAPRIGAVTMASPDGPRTSRLGRRSNGSTDPVTRSSAVFQSGTAETRTDRLTWQTPGTIPLPERMAAGHFRVVDNRGRVQELKLAVGELQYLGVEVDSEVAAMYTVSEGSVRWYFIRIDQVDPADGKHMSPNLATNPAVPAKVKAHVRK